MKYPYILFFILFVSIANSQNSQNIYEGLVFDNGEIQVYEKKIKKHSKSPKLYLKTPDTNVKFGENLFKYQVKNYSLQEQTAEVTNSILSNSHKGQHIHFIVDNKPYQAKYHPIFEANMTKGNHLVLAFLSRSFHESIKEKGAYVLKQYSIDTNEPLLDIKKTPLLFYSRPKGKYDMENAHKILLDFYLVNTILSKNGNKVKVTINDTSFILSKWAPYIIEGLKAGIHTIQIELIDSNNNLIQGSINNSGLRKFEIQ